MATVALEKSYTSFLEIVVVLKTKHLLFAYKYPHSAGLNTFLIYNEVTATTTIQIPKT